MPEDENGNDTDIWLLRFGMSASRQTQRTNCHCRYRRCRYYQQPYSVRGGCGGGVGQDNDADDKRNTNNL